MARPRLRRYSLESVFRFMLRHQFAADLKQQQASSKPWLLPAFRVGMQPRHHALNLNLSASPLAHPLRHICDESVSLFPMGQQRCQNIVSQPSCQRVFVCSRFHSGTVGQVAKKGKFTSDAQTHARPTHRFELFQCSDERQCSLDDQFQRCRLIVLLYQCFFPRRLPRDKALHHAFVP